MEYGYLDKEVKVLVTERDRLAAENTRLINQISDLEEIIVSLRERVDKLAIERSAFVLKKEDVLPPPKTKEYHGWTGLVVTSTFVDGMGCVDGIEFYWDRREADPKRNLVIAFRASRGGIQGPAVFVREEDLQSIADYIMPRLPLAAENAELRKKDGSGLIAEAEKLMKELAAANATLDTLRDAIKKQHAELFYVTAAKELSVGFDSKGKV